MNRDEARRVLGLDADADDAAIRDAHRRRIRYSHPDAGGSTHEAARLNEALATLRANTESSSPPHSSASSSPTRPSSPTGRSPEPARRPDDVDRFFVIDERPTALLARLAEAGHSVGEVVFVDPHNGLLEIIVGAAPAVGQLAVTVGDEQPGGTPVSFTLDALGVTPAPPIGEVVGALMDALAR